MDNGNGVQCPLDIVHHCHAGVEGLHRAHMAHRAYIGHLDQSERIGYFAARQLKYGHHIWSGQWTTVYKSLLDQVTGDQVVQAS